jgi:hypothetical protein
MVTPRIDIRNQVSRRLSSFYTWAQDIDTADASKTIFPLNYTNVDSLVVTRVDSSVTTTVSSSSYTLDADTGYVVFTTAPSATDTDGLIFTYRSRLWSDGLINDLIDDAMIDVSKEVPTYVTDSALTAAATTYEYAIPATIGHVAKVEILGSGATQYVTQQMWQTQNRGTTRYLQFRAAPTAGTIRLTGTSVPVSFTDDWTDTAADTVGTTWANTTDPLTISDATHTYVVGDVLKIESEYLRVKSVVAATSYTLERGYLNTTTASHAAGNSIYKAQTLESDCAMATKCVKPIVAYVVWQAYEQRLNAYTRDVTNFHADAAHGAKVYELHREADRLRLMYDSAKLAAKRTPEAYQ